MTVEFMAGPSLANPAAFDSVDELRNALHGANKDLVNLFYEHCAAQFLRRPEPAAQRHHECPTRQ